MNDNLAYLRQGITLLESLEADMFGACPPGLESGGIGPQFRHVIDYYACFTRDVATGRIDYDKRERDADLETDIAACRGRLNGLILELERLPLADLPVDIIVRADADPTLPEEQQFARSSPRRELNFLASHTIHHYALIAVTLQSHGVSPGSEFGVAPSTLRYWKSQGLTR